MAKFITDIPFFWGLVVVSILAAIFALRTWLQTRRVAQDAQADWDYRVSENMQDLRLTQDAYVRAYTKVHAPRAAKYITMTLTAVLVLTVPAFTLLQLAMHGIWQISGQSRTFEPPFLVYQFAIFFGIIGLWIALIGWFTKRYYRDAPGLMRDELIYERAGFMPDAKLTVGPNPTHIDCLVFSENTVDGRKISQIIFANALGLTQKTDDNWQDSGQICDVYSDGSGMNVHIHASTSEEGFNKDTHPFFFTRDYDKEIRYTIIVLSPDAYGVFDEIRGTGIQMDKITGSKTSRMCSFSCGKMDIFIYDERG
ncbi:MAG: hypothetical protein JKY25_08030 [Robiginitomaculum sp.]|nr:hypothetical protein [Robiginitomaculum sp.]